MRVSGDQRYLLHVNGHRVGAGPGRGDPGHWRFETYDLALWLKPGYDISGSTLTASVALPAGVEGVLVWNRREYPLHGGAQTLVAR